MNTGRLEELLPDNAARQELLAWYNDVPARALSLAPPSPSPLLLNVAGLPGAGKTTLALKILEEHPHLFYISFDRLMEEMPPYRETLRQRGPREAFVRWEQPARCLGYRLLEAGLARRLSILFEHGNAAPEHLDLYRRARSAGYRVEIRFIDVETHIAIERIRKRERFFPAEAVAERRALLLALNEEYKKIVHTFEIIRT